MKSRCFKLYRAYSIPFNSSNLGNFFWSSILKDCIEVQKEKKKVVALCSRPGTKREIRYFHQCCSRAVTAKKCTKKRDERAKLCSANLNLLLLCRSRWSRCRRCLSFLFIHLGGERQCGSWAQVTLYLPDPSLITMSDQQQHGPHINVVRKKEIIN